MIQTNHTRKEADEEYVDLDDEDEVSRLLEEEDQMKEDKMFDTSTFYQKDQAFTDCVSSLPGAVVIAADIRKGSGAKKFIVLHGGREALWLYNMKYPADERHLYEVIEPDDPAKLYLDLDKEAHEGDEPQTVVAHMDETQAKVVEKAKKSLKNEYGIELDDADILVTISDGLKANGKFKASRHIVVNVYFMNNHTAMKSFVVDHLHPVAPDEVDMRAYNRHQLLRLPGNCKKGDPRVLNPLHGGPLTQEFYERSLVTKPPAQGTAVYEYTAECKEEETDSRPRKMRKTEHGSAKASDRTSRGETSVHSDFKDAVDFVVNELVKPHEDVFVGKVKEVEDNSEDGQTIRVSLIRTGKLGEDGNRAQPCLLGGHHATNNAAIYINMWSGRVRYHCFGKTGHPGRHCLHLRPLPSHLHRRPDVSPDDDEELDRPATPSSSIPLDNISPNEVINISNIGSYLPRLEKADVVALRSNMMTHKTHNLEELMGHYKRILIISFRISLVDEYAKRFEKHEFKLYSAAEFQGTGTTVKGERIVVQVNSLWRVKGAFDLIILDEMVYTMNLLLSFVKEKREVWDALNQYIKGTPKIICCDALLDNNTIEIFRENGRSVWIVENKWMSFLGKTANFLPFGNDVSRICMHIESELEEWGTLFIPTNSKAFADKLFCYLDHKGVKVRLDSSDTGCTPPSQWCEYKVFITTPTNAAGVSCNEPFGKCICYFTPRYSCSAELSAQIMFRVRNVKSCTYDIIVKRGRCGSDWPLTPDAIKQWIKGRDVVWKDMGLNIDHIRDDIVPDEYYRHLVECTRKENMSKMKFKDVLSGILVVHGLRILEKPDEDLSDTDKLKQVQVKEDVKEQTRKRKAEKNKMVCEAKESSSAEYEIVKRNPQSAEERAMMTKYRLRRVYGNDAKLEEGSVDALEKNIPQYFNLKKMNRPDVVEEMGRRWNTYLEKNAAAPNAERLHEDHTTLKIAAAHYILRALGFDSVWDKKVLTSGFPYEEARQFLIRHGKKLAFLFKTDPKKNWRRDPSVDEKVDKQAIAIYINARLRGVCGVSVKNKHRGGRNNARGEYCIKGLELWEEAGIEFKDQPSVQAQGDTVVWADEAGRLPLCDDRDRATAGAVF